MPPLGGPVWQWVEWLGRRPQGAQLLHLERWPLREERWEERGRERQVLALLVQAGGLERCLSGMELQWWCSQIERRTGSLMVFQAAVVVQGGVQRLDLAAAWGAGSIRALLVQICGFALDRRASRARRLGSA